MAFICAVGGGVGAFVTWWMLGAVLWLPYWRQLRDHGMYAHDVEWAYLTWLGPPCIAVAFFVTCVFGLIALKLLRDQQLARRAVYLLNAIPAFGVLWALNTHLFGYPDIAGVGPRTWRYPLAELAILLVGVFCSWLLIKMYDWAHPPPLARSVPSSSEHSS